MSSRSENSQYIEAQINFLRPYFPNLSDGELLRMAQNAPVDPNVAGSHLAAAFRELAQWEKSLEERAALGRPLTPWEERDLEVEDKKFGHQQGRKIAQRRNLRQKLSDALHGEPPTPSVTGPSLNTNVPPFLEKRVPNTPAKTPTPPDLPPFLQKSWGESKSSQPQSTTPSPKEDGGPDDVPPFLKNRW